MTDSQTDSFIINFQSMLTMKYTNTVSLDGIYILISILSNVIQIRIFGRETY